jgi:hypothetical protein
MSMAAPHVAFHAVDDDLAHYTASVALDDVLGWFVDDGYTREQMVELALEHVERVMEGES